MAGVQVLPPGVAGGKEKVKSKKAKVEKQKAKLT
jgi:hypothetical protein